MQQYQKQCSACPRPWSAAELLLAAQQRSPASALVLERAQVQRLRRLPGQNFHDPAAGAGSAEARA
jgi:hypothetical protein